MFLSLAESPPLIPLPSVLSLSFLFLVSPYGSVHPLLRIHCHLLRFHAIPLFPYYRFCSSPTPFQSSISSLHLSPTSPIVSVTPGPHLFDHFSLYLISSPPSPSLSIAIVLFSKHGPPPSFITISPFLTRDISLPNDFPLHHPHRFSTPPALS